MTPFVVFGLPRSRTTWLSKFLTYGDWICGHEELLRIRSMEDVRAWFSQPCIGTAETAAAPFWRLLPDGVRVVTVRRPVDEVVASLLRLGIAFDVDALAMLMRRLGRKLDQIERRMPGVLSVRFADLASEATCAGVFEHCLPYKHDPQWWQRLATQNVQTNMHAMTRYFRAHYPQLAKLALIAKHQAMASMVRAGAEIEGVTIQQESFETFYRDGRSLFADHLVQVGEAPDAYAQKNLPLMRTLEQIGAMQITTARSNGRMFGYLMTIISPSLESPELTSAINTTFYASKEFPGLGMKLQRASLDALRKRGVDEVLMRAGTRGSGPRMSALYQRLGATDNGHLFMLKLKES